MGLDCVLESGNLWLIFFFFLMKRVGQFRNCSLNEEVKIHDDISRGRESKDSTSKTTKVLFYFLHFRS